MRNSYLLIAQAILVVCVVLQSADAGLDFDNQEVLTLDGYGNTLVGLTLAFIPVTVYFVYAGLADIKEIAKDTDAEEAKPETDGSFENPIGEDTTQE